MCTMDALIRRRRTDRAVTTQTDGASFGRRTYYGAMFVAVFAVCCLSGAHTTGMPGAALSGKTGVTRLHAEGVQIYQCTEDSAKVLRWEFREPLATLLLDGKTIGHHFAGPTWQLTSGDELVGKAVSQTPGESVKDIAWLKLEVVSRRGESFSNTSTVERINTHGGVFTGSCEQAGAFHAEPYSADYVFLGD
jgi:Protein of unknown function (DUF3455)